ncbi:MAG: PAS domain-containing protein, partial [Magnetovibrio sp.]|nr:PAS domain-containing protein [Magnetovibrio sp.]
MDTDKPSTNEDVASSVIDEQDVIRELPTPSSADNGAPAPDVLRAGPSPVAPLPEMARPEMPPPNMPSSDTQIAPHRSALVVPPPAVTPEPTGPQGPGPEYFRPARGPSPLAFALPALLFGGLRTAMAVGVLNHTDWAFDAGLVGNAALGLAIVFSALFAWSLGRRSHIDDEAALVCLAAGETGEPLMLSNAQGRVLYANAGFRELFQRKAVAEIPNALRFADQDAESPTAIRRMLSAAGGGAKENTDLEFTRVGGARAWWRLSARPAGKPGSGLVSWSAHDVTARRELDEVRRAEEALLADLLDNLPVGFFSVDGTGRIVYANDTLCSWLGIRLSDIRDEGLGFAEFVTELAPSEGDDGDSGQVTLQPRGGISFKAFLLQSGRINEGGELMYTRSIVVRDLVKKQSPPETTVVAHPQDDDISDIARRLYWLFDEAPVSIALLDMKANITDCNGAFLKMLGLHKDDVQNLPFTERLSKQDQGDVGGQLSKVVMGIMRAAHIEVRMPTIGGREVTASLFASRMEDGFGEVTGLILHFIDTTEHRHLEVQFAQSQKMQSIGQLAGGIAHDFNNLLTAMIGFSDLLLTRHGPEDPSFNDINQIRQNAVRATSLVRQLLAFSRKQTLEPQIVDAKEKLSELSEVMSRLIGPTIELNIEHSRDLGPIRVDPTQFDQVILNLAVNARDAMPGGGTLTIRTANVTLDEPIQRGMELVPAGDYITIDVIDTGEGIRKEDIDQIFEPFFTTKEVGQGTGLGLSTVYGIVHQTGGHVFVDSAPGEGAAFTVYLPRHVEDADQVTPSVNEKSVPSHPKAHSAPD